MTLLLVAVGLVACGRAASGDNDASVPPAAGGSAPVPSTETSRSSTVVMDHAVPVQIHLPALDVSAPIMKLGLQQDGTLEVPPGADRAGWYTGSPAPGEIGPAIAAAHINYNGQDGPFAELDTLEPGDLITIDRADGTTARFRVTTVEQYDKDQFPTQKVYGDIDHAGLRLITCGGAFNPALDSYEDNIVAYAQLVESPQQGRR